MSFGTIVEGFAHNIGFKDAKKGRAIIIGGFSLIIVAGVAYGIIKWRKRVNEEKEQERLSVSGSTTSQLDAVKVDGSKTTLSPGDAILISQNILGAMARMGTDSASILDNLNRCQTADDLKLIIKTFGVKLYTGTTLAADNFLSKHISRALNLNGWLRAELSGSDLANAQAIFNKFSIPF